VVRTRLRTRLPYTTLHAIKQALGGPLPPFVPLSGDAAKILATPGMGVIIADADGLECPVIGCKGRYNVRPGEKKNRFKALGMHITKMHPETGGLAKVKTLLGYPKTTPFVSLATHKKLHDAHVNDRISAPRRSPKGGGGRGGAGYQNLKFSCLEQIKLRFIQLSEKLGHQPSYNEWRDAGYPWVWGHRTAFSTWNKLVAYCGGIPKKRGQQNGDPN